MKDTWRAILVIAVVTILRHEEAVWQAAKRAVSPSVETTAAVTHEAWRPAPAPAPAPAPPVQGNGLAQPPVGGYHWQNAGQPQIVVTQEPKRPLRRVAAALTEVGDSLIGVVR